MATTAGISRHSASHSSSPSRHADDYSPPCSALWVTLLVAERQPGPPDLPGMAACRNMDSHSTPSSLFCHH